MPETIHQILKRKSVRGTQKGDQLQRLLTWGNLFILTALVVSASPVADTQRLVLMFPNGLTGG